MIKPNRPGRPTLDEEGAPSTQVGVRLPTKDFDDLCQRAARERITVAEVIRRDIRRGSKHDPTR
jgi:hypothetical protein